MRQLKGLIMEYLKGLEHYKDTRRSAVTFGKFDGLHRGHQTLIRKVAQLRQTEQVRAAVCAFDMKRTGILMTKEERAAHLEDSMDYLVECPFSEELRKMSGEEFIKEIICGVFHAKYVVVGTDFHFGYGQGGDADMLKEYAGVYGYEAIVLEKERYQGRIISSTYIKELMAEGNIQLADKLLGYPYSIKGVVEHGRRLGRTLGFPTFNVEWPQAKIVPPRGVYFSRTWLDGKCYAGITNVGVKPTVSTEDKVLAESFLFDYEGSAYGKEVRVELLDFRRPERKFADIQEMKAAIDRDIESGREYFRKNA